MTPRSGQQHHIRAVDQEVVVTEVGAALRQYRVGGVEVVDGFEAGEICPSGRGQVLAPWPNRLDHGRYTFGGRDGVASINEPERSNAIHGLVRWLKWQTLGHSDGHVELGCTLEPQPAYPWRVVIAITYALGVHGLSVATEVVNESDDVAPFGLGFHPYLALGLPADDLLLQVSAESRLVTDERGLPTSSEDVAGTKFDFRRPRQIGAMQLDTAFGGINPPGGRPVASLVTPDLRRALQMWVGPEFTWLQVFTGDSLPDAERRRRSVAIEPMTCPPNALATGADVIKLHPGTPWRAVWGIRPMDGVEER